jgi:protein-S-isoprenylcysteine O-methyltransferase Ste14
MILVLKSLAYLVISFLIFALALFLPAGTTDWPAGWIFLILVYSVSCVGVGLLFKYNPGLLQERMSFSQPNQKTWDKVFIPLYYLLCLAWVVLIPLDAVRFHWSHMPLFLQIVGAIALVGSFPPMFLTFRENSFLASTVRVQVDRGQTVVSTGPYHYVRHPMYASAILFFLGTPLLLGSWYGLLPALVAIAGMAVRAVMEERVLREELPGYDAYMAQVKYRLIPYVW